MLILLLCDSSKILIELNWFQLEINAVTPKHILLDCHLTKPVADVGLHLCQVCFRVRSCQPYHLVEDGFEIMSVFLL